MGTVADSGAKIAGLEALYQLKSTEPPLYLASSPELSKAARSASEYLFSSLSPYAPKSPFTHLLTEGFDVEQIWQQIDLQAQPLLTSLRRHVRYFEKNPEEIQKQFNLDKAGKVDKMSGDGDNKGIGVSDSESEDMDDDKDQEDEEEEDEEEEEGGEDADGDREKLNGVDDEFFKMKELEELIADDEARKYGMKEKKKRKRDLTLDEEDESEDEKGNEDEEYEDEEEEDDELELVGLEGDDNDDERWENARYEDFFVRKKSDQKRKPKHFGGSDDMDMVDETEDDDDDSKNKESVSTDEKQLVKPHSQAGKMEKANSGVDVQGESLSTHEVELARLRTHIEEMERANLEPKAWTMQGEVTAAKRPKNSALEVDLDFEHNVRPAPVITEEVTASLEELIQKRILEGQFDDVQKPPAVMAKPQREKMELDENRSKKGLAELYEDEYAQKTGLVSAALSFSDEQKKEANMLFKKLCVKLDALSHFHFTPKPVIEDMSIQANVPALAIEEIAPLAVSDAAMLAPEEVFSGKGDIKEETELTKEERKRRRANKKRKFKAETSKKMAMKAQQTAMKTQDKVNEDS